MARILISEPHEEVQRLLERMVARLGHQPVAVRVPTPRQLTSADVFIVEPAAPISVVLAQAARLLDPSLPIVCASVAAPPADLEELGVVFAASLLKPFSLAELGAAIDQALRAREAHEDRRRRESRPPEDPFCEDSRPGDPGREDRAA